MTDLKKTDSEAAGWVVRLHSDQRTHADREAFNAWMEADPANVDAFSAHAAIWDSVAAWGRDPEAREVLRFSPLWSGFGRRVVQWSAGAAALAATVAMALILPGLLSGEQRFSTAPGELRTVSLADGSTLTLNTDTQLITRFSAGERRVVLDRGQAYFRVAKDSVRPFRVFVGHDEVRAVGTAFDVWRIGDRAEVVLEEGRLAIFRGGDHTMPPAAKPAIIANRSRPVASPPPTLFLNAGQSLDLGPVAVAAPRNANMLQSSAWRYGRMVFDDTRLGDAVADLNRYGGPQISLADSRLADIRISGVFHTGQPYDIVGEVVTAFPVRVASDDGRRIVLAPSTNASAAKPQNVVKNSR